MLIVLVARHVRPAGLRPPPDSFTADAAAPKSDVDVAIPQSALRNVPIPESRVKIDDDEPAATALLRRYLIRSHPSS